MGHVDRETQAVHLAHHFASHAGEAPILRLITARREQRLVVISELHESQAQPMEDFERADVVLDAGWILSAEEDRGPSLILGAAHVIASPGQKYQVGKLREAAIPTGDVGGRLAEI